MTTKIIHGIRLVIFVLQDEQQKQTILLQTITIHYLDDSGPPGEERNETNGDEQGLEDEDDEDESDDDVQITIGDIKSGPAAYAGFNVKRGPGATAPGTGDKSKVFSYIFYGQLNKNQI